LGALIAIWLTSAAGAACVSYSLRISTLAVSIAPTKAVKANGMMIVKTNRSSWKDEVGDGIRGSGVHRDLRIKLSELLRRQKRMSRRIAESER
jgi:hypothetical protein